jgi:hypothetical protein
MLWKIKVLFYSVVSNALDVTDNDSTPEKKNVTWSFNIWIPYARKTHKRHRQLSCQYGSMAIP